MILLAGLKTYLEQRPKDRDSRKITISGIGKCSRQMAYKFHGFKEEPLSWKSHIVFDDGDMAHEQLRKFLEKCVPHTGWELVDVEAPVTVKTPKGREVVGHIDGRLRNLDNDDQKLLEIKSMSSSSYSKPGIEDSYQRQMDGYLRGSGMEEAVFLKKCKDNGELDELKYVINNELLDKQLVEVDKVVDSKAPNQVERSYGPDKNGKLDWHCAYCPFWKQCWEDKAVMGTGPKGGKFLTLR